MNKIRLTFLILITCFFSFGQTKNYSEKEILENQRKTTVKIIVALQKNNDESILQYFDNINNDIHKKLKSCVAEIEKFKNSTMFSDVIVFDEGYNIFRCRYSDKTRARFQIDLYFHTENPNSKVVQIKTKTDQILKKEYKERMNSTEIPPAPPKPDGK
ncbi:hypothetical protein CJ739_2860 [Mariniflexile rhizosphaerae]|uniref:hypothetical protein n=1 Tax=unclassified Mariniflexile TaxID=2643887 RepID=UPI000CB88932|nr:hypothetical protein [Mariniflexile sp. TRM1-10]AXP81925.1 hypothetical protein CJ739_2860 [Mariniflexile sp. TRM1-10]PLB20687.1 MAG: hypothetical protein TRG1_255 [Flavobacteriaceae bacterium FS1-H7996/R]